MPTISMCPALAAATLACAFVSGCATDCASDWYAIGQRDGRIGAALQDEYYAARCAVPVDHARYVEGWEAGFAERPTPLW